MKIKIIRIDETSITDSVRDESKRRLIIDLPPGIWGNDLAEEIRQAAANTEARRQAYLSRLSEAQNV